MPTGVYERSEEAKRQNRIKTIGKHWKLTDETKRKISLGKKGKKINRVGSSQKGKKRTIEERKKIGDEHRGDKCHFWQGGIVYSPYADEWNNVLRESIRIRDSFICQECGMHQDELTGRTRKMDVHHIDYDKENCNPTNLITLCRKCHMATNRNRDFWEEYFKEIN